MSRYIGSMSQIKLRVESMECRKPMNYKYLYKTASL